MFGDLFERNIKIIAHLTSWIVTRAFWFVDERNFICFSKWLLLSIKRHRLVIMRFKQILFSIFHQCFFILPLNCLLSNNTIIFGLIRQLNLFNYSRLLSYLRLIAERMRALRRMILILIPHTLIGFKWTTWAWLVVIEHTRRVLCFCFRWFRYFVIGWCNLTTNV